MNKLQKKIGATIASGALLMQLLPGVALAQGGVTCSITNNGSDTTNTCDFTAAHNVDVDQNNDADIDNDVDVYANTGHNEAEDNTGGDTAINTGSVTTDVTVSNAVNTNSASVEGTSASRDYTLEVSGNGTDSDNSVDVDVTDDVDVDQDNDAHVRNNVEVSAKTGGNEAEDNTGGSVMITTGNVVSNEGVSVATAVNANSAMVSGGDQSGDLSLRIVDNGSDTDNDIDLTLGNDVELDQDNDAYVHNDVDFDAYTGGNEAEDNTGGDNGIETGMVDVDVAVDTMANFNQANVEGGFLMGDVELKVGENGTYSDNLIDLDLSDDLDADQDNDLNVDNHDIDVDGHTGGNEIEDNTFGDGDDPTITTGGFSSEVGVSTSGNANVFGGELDMDFDLSELMGALQALKSILMGLDL